MDEVEMTKEMERDIEARVSAMSENQRAHLRSLIYEFVRCYDKDNDDCAVIILGTGTGIDNIITIDCDGMEAAQLMLGANDFFGYLNTKDAPPKEMFN
jgi:hypothetical protein